MTEYQKARQIHSKLENKNCHLGKTLTKNTAQKVKFSIKDF